MFLKIELKKKNGEKVTYIKNASLITLSELNQWSKALAEKGSELNIISYDEKEEIR